MDVNWTPSIVAAVIAFVGVLIFVHELGHFLAAKLFDIKVVKFSLGFGPPLVAFQKGETTYQIAAVPLGGYVRMVGDNPHDEVDPRDQARSFSGAPVYQRAIVALAGPAFNMLFPVLCFFAYNLLEPVQQAPLVGTVEIGKPAQVAGLEPGDRVVAVDGERVWSFTRMTDLIRARPATPSTIEVERDGERLAVDITPEKVTGRNQFGEKTEHGLIGIKSLMPASRIGVADPAKSPGDFRTGDRITAIAGQPVKVTYEVDRALKRHAGEAVEIALARPTPHRSGDLLRADAEAPVVQTVTIPEGTTRMEDLGWAPSGAFIRQVVSGGPADRAGLRPGDRLLAVDGEPFRLFFSFVEAVQNSEGEPLAVTVERGGEERTFTLDPAAVECLDDIRQKPRTIYDHGLGAGHPEGEEVTCGEVAAGMQTLAHWAADLPPEMEPVRLSLGEAFVLSLEQTGDSIATVGGMVYRLFTGDVSHKNLGGPLSFFTFAAMAAERGVFTYLYMLAVLSINLALLNLLPIPVLDGGHLLFCAVEAVKRKPVSLRVKEAAMMVGMALLLALFVLAFSNDLANLGIF